MVNAVSDRLFTVLRVVKSGRLRAKKGMYPCANGDASKNPGPEFPGASTWWVENWTSSSRMFFAELPHIVHHNGIFSVWVFREELETTLGLASLGS